MKPASFLAVRITLGILFLILGIIGGFVPVMQGWIFLLLALLMLFPAHPLTEKTLLKAEKKMPRLVRLLRRMGVGAPKESGEIVPSLTHPSEPESPQSGRESG